MMFFEEDCQLGFAADETNRRRADPLLDGATFTNNKAPPTGFNGTDFRGPPAFQPGFFY